MRLPESDVGTVEVSQNQQSEITDSKWHVVGRRERQPVPSANDEFSRGMKHGGFILLCRFRSKCGGIGDAKMGREPDPILAL